jgi:uncharacterized integral membrane protein (TIGR00697 family)
MVNNKWSRENGSTKITNPILSAEVPHKYLGFLGMIWLSFLILTSFASIKTFDLFGMTFFAISLTYPVTYIFSDIFTEVYGYKISRKIIWSGFLCLTLISTTAYLFTLIPPSIYFNENDAFNTIFRASPILALAAILSFFNGEIVNSYVLAQMKLFFKGKRESLRYILSTFLGHTADNATFILVTIFLSGIFSFEEAYQGALNAILIGVVWEIIALPFTKRFIKWIKEKEGIDTYDHGTNFNPFKLG